MKYVQSSRISQACYTCLLRRRGLWAMLAEAVGIEGAGKWVRVYENLIGHRDPHEPSGACLSWALVFPSGQGGVVPGVRRCTPASAPSLASDHHRLSLRRHRNIHDAGRDAPRDVASGHSWGSRKRIGPGGAGPDRHPHTEDDLGLAITRRGRRGASAGSPGLAARVAQPRVRASLSPLRRRPSER